MAERLPDDAATEPDDDDKHLADLREAEPPETGGPDLDPAGANDNDLDDELPATDDAKPPPEGGE